MKDDIAILVQESCDSRIVQRKHPTYRKWIIARERATEVETGLPFFKRTVLRWKISEYLYTCQCSNLEEYIDYFNIQEARTPIGLTPQF